jgi:hypothetical protein
VVNPRFSGDCGKVAYPSLKEAQTVLNRLRQHRGKNVVERIYVCSICGYHHFTSVELNANRVPPGAYLEPKYADRWQKLLDANDNAVSQE